MDVYLPADFHALHDDVVTDWRDMPNDTRDVSAIAEDTAQRVTQDVDPSWLAI